MLIQVKLLFLYPFLLFAHATLAMGNGFVFDAHNQLAYQQLLKLKIDSASFHLNLSDVLAEENGLNIYFRNYEDMLRLFLTQDRELFDQLKENEKQRLKRLAKLDKNSPYYLFTQAEVALQWAFVRMYFSDYFNAFFDFKKAYSLIHKNEELFPDFLPNKKTLGTIQVMLGAVPGKYHWLLNAFGLSGNFEQGFDNLKEAASTANPFQLEAQLAYGYLQAYLLGNTSAACDDFVGILDKHQDNLLVYFSTAVVAMKAAKGKLAWQVLQKAPKGKDYPAFAYLDYLRGEAALQIGKYQAASKYLEKFTREYKGNDFLKDAYFKLFLANWFLGDAQKAEVYKGMTKTEGATNIDADKYALSFVEMNPLPSREITKARFLTDGGEYELGLEILNQIVPEDLISAVDKAELPYRKARVYHGMQQFDKAITFYKATIDLPKSEMYYFAPNSALQLGYLYRDYRRDKAKAVAYFQMAIAYKNHPYQTGITNKAKAALQQL